MPSDSFANVVCSGRMGIDPLEPVTWALVPLVIPALGCAALAVVAVPERPRRHAG